MSKTRITDRSITPMNEATPSSESRVTIIFTNKNLFV
jgi:hypothetical protein